MVTQEWPLEKNWKQGRAAAAYPGLIIHLWLLYHVSFKNSHSLYCVACSDQIQKRPHSTYPVVYRNEQCQQFFLAIGLLLHQRTGRSLKLWPERSCAMDGKAPDSLIITARTNKPPQSFVQSDLGFEFSPLTFIRLASGNSCCRLCATDNEHPR